jgi:hypothetical protein
MTKVEYTGCPITMLILKNKPNFPRFSLKNEDFVQKQTQTNPILPVPMVFIGKPNLSWRKGAKTDSCLPYAVLSTRKVKSRINDTSIDLWRIRGIMVMSGPGGESLYHTVQWELKNSEVTNAADSQKRRSG